MRLSSGGFVRASLILGLVALGFVGLRSARSIASLDAGIAAASEGHDVLETSARIAGGLSGFESAAARDRLADDVRRLRELASGDAAREAAVADIAASVERRFAGGPGAEGAAEGARASLAALDRDERRRLAERAEVQTRRVRAAASNVALGGGMSVALLIGALIALEFHARARARRQREMVETLGLLRAVTEGTNDAIWAKDLDGRYTLMNDAGARLLGRAVTEIVGRNDAEIFPAEEARNMEKTDRRVLESGRTESFEQRATSGGVSRTFLSTKGAFRGDGGAVSGLVGISRDITERKQRERDIEAMNERLRDSVVEQTRRAAETRTLGEMGELLQACADPAEAHGVLAAGLERMFPGTAGYVAVSRASRNLLEGVAAWGGADASSLAFPPDDCWGLRRGRPHVARDVAAGATCRHAAAHDGWTTVCVPMTAHGEPVGILHLCRPVPAGTENDPRQVEHTDDLLRLAGRAAEQAAMALANLSLRETLRQQSIRDPLTGLYNRRFLEESLRRELARAGRRGKPLGVIAADLDHFKQFNDRHGHEAGDQVLARVSERLVSLVRPEDVVCRYGGEEFVILLVEAPLDDTTRKAESLLKAVRELDLRSNGRGLGKVTLSMGVAASPPHGAEPAALLRHADAALYAAKAAGRDRVCVATGVAAPEPLPA